MDIYHRPHKSRKSEAEFFEMFRKKFPNANYPDKCYRVEDSYLSKYVSQKALLAALQNNQYLPTNQREKCINHLKDCPTLLKVALKSTSISFDLVIIDKGISYYWEYHEDQHRKLKDNREKKLYDAETDKEVPVPRCLQRLVRDIWRIHTFPHFSIVWKDWFESNKSTFEPEFQTGLSEYFTETKFSFRKFYEIYYENLQ